MVAGIGNPSRTSKASHWLITYLYVGVECIQDQDGGTGATVSSSKLSYSNFIASKHKINLELGSHHLNHCINEEPPKGECSRKARNGGSRMERSVICFALPDKHLDNFCEAASAKEMWQ